MADENGMRKWVMEARALLAMLLVQVMGTIMQILNRVVLKDGALIFAIIMYRHFLAAIVVLPFALYFERSAAKKINLETVFWIFMVALSGISLGMGLFCYGLKDTSASYAINFLNLIPIITFIFSILLRIEKLGIKTRPGKVKILGALLSLTGALIIALYKGKSFHLIHRHHHDNVALKNHENMTRGTLFLTASCLFYAVWYILQVKLFKVFPHKLWATLLTCLMATAQAGVIGLYIDKNLKHWKLSWNLQLLTIVYSAMFGSAVTIFFMSWVISKKGPTYTSMFNPVSLVMTTVVEALILGQEIFLGSLIGMGVITVGLYVFLWAKNKESKATLSSDDCGGGGGRSSGTVAPAAEENA